MSDTTEINSLEDLIRMVIGIQENCGCFKCHIKRKVNNPEFKCTATLYYLEKLKTATKSYALLNNLGAALNELPVDLIKEVESILIAEGYPAYAGLARDVITFYEALQARKPQLVAEIRSKDAELEKAEAEPETKSDPA